MTLLELMRSSPVIPVIVINDVDQAVPLARALVAGGVRVLEVTLRTSAALDAVRAIAQEVEARLSASAPSLAPTTSNGRSEQARCSVSVLG